MNHHMTPGAYWRELAPHGLMRGVHIRLVGLCLGWMLLSPICASAYQISGTVDGVTASEALTILGLSSRNLHRGQSIIRATSAVSDDGRFELTWDDGPSSLWIIVARVSSSVERAALLRAPRVMAVHEPVSNGTDGVLLRVPSTELTQSIWRGGVLSHMGQQAAGALLVLFLSMLAAWLSRRRSTEVRSSPQPKATRHGMLWCVAAVAVLSVGLGAEPLDLLEYSYFHEGVRPVEAGDVLTDPISAELAHGPVMPLILRGVSTISTHPFALRLPSVLFGALFVLCVFAILRHALGEAPAHLGALLALASPVAWFYARDATPYAFTGFAAALSAWIAFHGSSKTRPWAAWSGFALVQVIGFYAHYGYAFFSAALGCTLLIVWWRDRPRSLSYALIAFAIAGVLPVLHADRLFTMLQSSGARFALMAPVYPESPGVVRFILQFLTVLSGLPEWLPVALICTVPLWVLGIRDLFAKASVLAWFCVLQTALLLAWLLFSHTMSVEFGGGKVFYAYRWTRPLLLGVIIPFAALGLRSRLRWLVGILAAGMLVQSVVSDRSGRRPEIDLAIDTLSEHIADGDAWAVLPAAFYADPLLYSLHAGSPPQYITEMNTFDSVLSGRDLHGPLVEAYQPFETVVDRLQFERIWIFAFAEEMFGTPKFEPSVTRRTLQGLLAEGWTKTSEYQFGYLALYSFECGLECDWFGGTRLSFRLDDRLAVQRYLVQPPGSPYAPIPTKEMTLSLPRGARSLVVHTADSVDGAVQISGAQCQASAGVQACDLSDAGSIRSRVSMRFTGEMSTADAWVEVTR